MTDQEWKTLKMTSDYKDTYCYQENGNNCLSNNVGRCVCLYNTNFPDNICPFFKDKRGMTEEELQEYRRLFCYRRADLNT